MACALIYYWPIQVASWILFTSAIATWVTYGLGGFHILELDIFPVDLTEQNNILQQKPTPISNSPWTTLVNLLGNKSASARRSSYLKSLRHRANISK